VEHAYDFHSLDPSGLVNVLGNNYAVWTIRHGNMLSVLRDSENGRFFGEHRINLWQRKQRATVILWAIAGEIP